MNSPAAEVFIPISLFAMTFGCVYVAVMAWHRQRMAMIEKGLTRDDLEKGAQGSSALAIGLTSLGVGLGLGIGWFVDKVINGADWGENPLPYFISVLICGGTALVYYHGKVVGKKSN
ncbi:MAG: hypothetical protein IPH05_16755 [Flavobacteriales bacterium]|jgi:F0F1-type ATP synthase assembly protein I|nr:hypothetical protein [Flavobacteriales bacterium]MBK6884547.1 hypothetical protein [Flavobacteriales bacterium]MBK7100948.1 hypothetical protein [Flavobacteriales bacterium]MBK7111633.1 hypothetical protein [Flavobacteriales bacterium]MBK7484005.1 hypothetical protein [Flavobacteriales bacterium]